MERITKSNGMKEPLWTVENAAEAIRSGSHQLHNDTGVFKDLKIFMETCGAEDFITRIENGYYFFAGKIYYGDKEDETGKPIIKLSEIDFNQPNLKSRIEACIAEMQDIVRLMG